MIEGSFDARTLARMNVALDRVCEHTPLGEQHEVRERVAQGIIRCAKSGRTTLRALREAGGRALGPMPQKLSAGTCQVLENLRSANRLHHASGQEASDR